MHFFQKMAVYINFFFFFLQELSYFLSHSVCMVSIRSSFHSLLFLFFFFFFFNKVFASLTALFLLRKISLLDGVGLPLASPDMLYKERTPKTNLRGSQSGGYLSRALSSYMYQNYVLVVNTRMCSALPTD